MVPQRPYSLMCQVHSTISICATLAIHRTYGSAIGRGAKNCEIRGYTCNATGWVLLRYTRTSTDDCLAEYAVIFEESSGPYKFPGDLLKVTEADPRLNLGITRQYLDDNYKDRRIHLWRVIRVAELITPLTTGTWPRELPKNQTIAYTPSMNKPIIAVYRNHGVNSGDTTKARCPKHI